MDQGYGALGRESARLLNAMGMRIIACNTTGQKTPQDGVSFLLTEPSPKSQRTIYE